MRVTISDEPRPMYGIEDLPEDDEWIDVTAMGERAERFIGRRTGDILEVEHREGRVVAVRRKAATTKPSPLDEAASRIRALHTDPEGCAELDQYALAIVHALKVIEDIRHRQRGGA